LAAQFGIENTFRDLGAMVDETQPEAVLVAVSHDATVAATAELLRRGIPCLVEKPAGLDSAETSALADLADERGVPTIVAVNRRFYSVLQQALLAVTAHGPVRGLAIEAHESLLSQVRRGRHPGWLLDRWLIANTIHLIDLLRFAGGEVAETRVLSSGIFERHGDHIAASMRFSSGALGTFAAHFDSGGGTSLKIFGDGVTAELGPIEQGYLRYDDGRRMRLHESEADRRYRPGLYAQAAHFLESVILSEPAPFPASSLRDNVESMRLAEAFLAQPYVERAPARL
jgi:predicted dehydrogenase